MWRWAIPRGSSRASCDRQKTSSIIHSCPGKTSLTESQIASVAKPPSRKRSRERSVDRAKSPIHRPLKRNRLREESSTKRSLVLLPCDPVLFIGKVSPSVTGIRFNQAGTVINAVSRFFPGQQCSIIRPFNSTSPLIPLPRRGNGWIMEEVQQEGQVDAGSSCS